MKARPKEPDYFTIGVTSASIAALLQMSKRRVSQLAAAGVITRIGRDRYSPDLGSFIEYRVNLAKEKLNKTTSSSEFDTEQLRRIRRQNDHADDQLVARQEVEETIAFISKSVVTGIASIPTESAATGDVYERLNAVCNDVSMGIHARAESAIAKLANGLSPYDVKGM